jgi:hypothetical protein
MHERRTIVFARNIALESPIVTNTHNYAIQFARAGWAAWWVPKPATPWNWFRLGPVEPEKYGVRQRRLLFPFNYGGKRLNSHKLLWDLFPCFPLAPGRRAMAKEGLLRPDLFFAGSLETASLYKLLKPKAFVYNAHDAFSLYPGAPLSLRAIEAEVVRRATLTVTTAETTRELLISRYGACPDRAINLGHGVSNSAYAGVTEPERLKAIPHPRAVCLGTLDMQGTELVSKTVCSLPEVNFVFIGPGGAGLRACLDEARAANHHFLGPIYQDELPSYLSFCDVGLIAYDVRLKDSRLYGSNPMKRYDYSAAGLQVVSVDLLEYRKTPSPMYVASSPDEYARCVRTAVKARRYSRDEIRQFALANDWSAKYEALVRRLEELHAVSAGGARQRQATSKAPRSL